MAHQAGPSGLDAPLTEQLADQPELLSAFVASALPLLADDGAALGATQDDELSADQFWSCCAKIPAAGATGLGE